DYARQAKESVAIGANKAAIKSNKAERYVNQKRVEEDRQDLREARGDYRGNYKGNYNDRDMSPSAGRDSSFWGMSSVNQYPDSREARMQEENRRYWQESRAQDRNY